MSDPRQEALEKARARVERETNTLLNTYEKYYVQPQIQAVGRTAIDYFGDSSFERCRQAIAYMMVRTPSGDDESFDYYPGAFEALQEYLTFIMGSDYIWSPESDYAINGWAIQMMYEILPYDIAMNIETDMAIWGVHAEYDADEEPDYINGHIVPLKLTPVPHTHGH